MEPLITRWMYCEAQTGKNELDTHFAFLNRQFEKALRAEKIFTTPKELYDVLKYKGGVANSHAMIIDAGNRTNYKGIFQKFKLDGIRNVHDISYCQNRNVDDDKVIVKNFSDCPEELLSWVKVKPPAKRAPPGKRKIDYLQFNITPDCLPYEFTAGNRPPPKSKRYDNENNRKGQVMNKIISSHCETAVAKTNIQKSINTSKKFRTFGLMELIELRENLALVLHVDKGV